jgi:carnitine O-acetyltransferase
VKNKYQKWQPHDLQASLLACVADIRLYLQPFTILRFRVVGWLFTKTTRGPQKALALQLESGHCAARAEGIARLYLSGRKSVAFHNHFPILVQLPPHINRPCSGVVSAIIQSLCLIARKESIFSIALRTARTPAMHCDYLNVPSPSEHFAVLCNGRVFSIALSVSHEPKNLQLLIESIMSVSHTGQAINEPRLGECSVLARATWHKVHKSIIADSPYAGAVSAALDTLRKATFLICIDSDSSPKDLTSLGKALRFENIANRFFDKGIQLVVFGNGECGFLCDHSIIDGVEAMRLAAEIHANLPQSIIASETKLTVNQASHFYNEIKYQLPPSRATTATTNQPWFNVQLQNTYSFSLTSVAFDTQRFGAPAYPADTLIQFAIQLCFFQCLGFLPSVFEPVSLSHLPGGRLDFISPVSKASQKLLQSIIDQTNLEQQHRLLDEAALHHREQIRIAKQGRGHIGHLLALTALEFPNNQRVGATWLRLKESFFAKIDPGSRLLTQRDVVASNGGYNPAVKLFGTMTHRDDLFGIGYMLSPNGLTLDIQANGKYAQYGDAFTNAFSSALAQIEKIAAHHLLEAKRADAI